MASTPPEERFALPPLPATEPSWSAFQVWWQQVKEAIERNEVRQGSILDALDEDIYGAEGLLISSTVGGSFSIPTMILTAADAGASATITIASHVRRYPNGEEVSVNGAVITGFAFSTRYGVYYDDKKMLGGAVSYVATADLEEAQHSYAPGRHYCGTVTTPADGAGPTTGGSPPAGSGYTAGASAVVIT